MWIHHSIVFFSSFAQFVGNVLFREFCRDNQDKYIAAVDRTKKSDVANTIIAQVTEKGGQFLEPLSAKDAKDKYNRTSNDVKMWVVAAKKKILRKVKQSLREKDYVPRSKRVARETDTSSSLQTQETKDKEGSFSSQAQAESYSLALDQSLGSERNPGNGTNFNHLSNLLQLHQSLLLQGQQSQPQDAENISVNSTTQAARRQSLQQFGGRENLFKEPRMGFNQLSLLQQLQLQQSLLLQGRHQQPQESKNLNSPHAAIGFNHLPILQQLQSQQSFSSLGRQPQSQESKDANDFRLASIAGAES